MKNKKRLVKFTIGVIVSASLAYMIYSYFNSPSYFLSKLPEKYKHFPTLKNQITSAHHEITKLFSGGKVKEVYVDSVHHVLAVTKMTEISKPDQEMELQMVYYRVGKNGDLIDSLKETSKGEMGNAIDGQLLYDEYYTNYLLSGHTDHEPYVNYNRELQMNPAKLQKLVDSLNVLAQAVKSDSKTDHSILKDVTLFSIGLKIHRVFTTFGSMVTTESKFRTAFQSIGPITSYFSSNKLYDYTDKHSLMQVDYFLKQQHNNAWSTGYMAPAPMSATANWGGIGYFSIHFPGDTLFFKHPTTYHDDLDFTQKKPYYENNEWAKLDLFMLPGFSFQLITVGYDTDFKDPLDGCYLVKRR